MTVGTVTVVGKEEMSSLPHELLPTMLYPRDQQDVMYARSLFPLGSVAPFKLTMRLNAPTSPSATGRPITQDDSTEGPKAASNDPKADEKA
jgi:hypothetical protein